MTAEQQTRMVLARKLAEASKAILNSGWDQKDSTFHLIPAELREKETKAMIQFMDNLSDEILVLPELHTTYYVSYTGGFGRHLEIIRGKVDVIAP